MKHRQKDMVMPKIECIRCDVTHDWVDRKDAKGWGWLQYPNGWCCRYCKAEETHIWIDTSWTFRDRDF